MPPASVAEWTLQGDGFRDFYDGKYVDFGVFTRFVANEGTTVV